MTARFLLVATLVLANSLFTQSRANTCAVEGPDTVHTSVRELIAADTSLRGPGITPLSQPGSAGDVPPGKNYALLVATDAYDDSQGFPKLANPTADVDAINKELRGSYGFETKVLNNPSLMEIRMALRSYKTVKGADGVEDDRAYNPADQLLVYFAGHGIYDKSWNDGFIVAKDSRFNDVTRSGFFGYSGLKSFLDGLGCKHVLLVLDVCRGGTFLDNIKKSPGARGGGSEEVNPRLSLEELMAKKQRIPTRKILASSENENVSDGDAGKHSPFASQLLKDLRTYGGKKGFLTFHDICASVEDIPPGPVAADFDNSGEGGDFFFVSQSTKGSKQ